MPPASPNLTPANAPFPFRATQAEITFGNEAFHHRLAWEIRNARREICDFVHPETAQGHEEEDMELFRAYSEAMDRGVSVRFAMPELMWKVLIAYYVHKEHGKLRFLASDGHIRVLPQVWSPFTVFDRERVLLCVREPVKQMLFRQTILIHDPEFAGKLAADYDRMWESKARPVDRAEVLGPNWRERVAAAAPAAPVTPAAAQVAQATGGRP
ncbi:MAG: hypothetical protein KIT79_03485 [Deltaproteobacteria bacterium]|nr:hypothetical protein [Deltaproteobacteria bacterium]